MHRGVQNFLLRRFRECDKGRAKQRGGLSPVTIAVFVLARLPSQREGPQRPTLLIRTLREGDEGRGHRDQRRQPPPGRRQRDRFREELPRHPGRQEETKVALNWQWHWHLLPRTPTNGSLSQPGVCLSHVPKPNLGRRRDVLLACSSLPTTTTTTVGGGTVLIATLKWRCCHYNAMYR